MRIYVVLFILLLNVISAKAQTLASFDKWIDYPVGSSYLKKAISAETYDGNNTWVAIQIDTSASKKYQQLLRLDIDGNLIFAKQHNTKGFIYNIKATPDDGCLLIGVTAQGSYWVGWVAKCDKFGEIQWSYSYGEPNINIYFEQAVLAKNGNYVVAGYAYNSGNGGVVAMEIDTLGNMQWVQYYDSGNSSPRHLARIMVLDDGSYVLGTYYEDTPCYGRLIRVKSNGDVWYHNTYQLSSCLSRFGIRDFIPVQHPQKHFYFLLGYGYHSSRLLETDSLGVVLKTDTVDIRDNVKLLHYNPIKKEAFFTEAPYYNGVVFFLDSLKNVKIMMNKKPTYYGHVYLGYFSKENNILISVDNKDNSKIQLLKRNRDDFNINFCKDTLLPTGKYLLGYTQINDILPTSKPTYTRQFLSHSSQNISVSIHTECSKATSIEENLFNSTQQEIFVYPNPAQTYLYIKLPEQNTDIRIWDMYGKLVYERKNLNTFHKIDIEHFSQGLYNAEIQTNHQKQFQKFLKID